MSSEVVQDDEIDHRRTRQAAVVACVIEDLHLEEETTVKDSEYSHLKHKETCS